MFSLAIIMMSTINGAGKESIDYGFIIIFCLNWAKMKEQPPRLTSDISVSGRWLDERQKINSNEHSSGGREIPLFRQIIYWWSVFRSSKLNSNSPKVLPFHEKIDCKCSGIQRVKLITKDGLNTRTSHLNLIKTASVSSTYNC